VLKEVVSGKMKRWWQLAVVRCQYGLNKFICFTKKIEETIREASRSVS